MAEWRLPRVNQDDGIWGDILVQFLEKEHYNDDTDNSAANGGHQNITIRPGTTSAAPIKFDQTSAALLSSATDGTMEYVSNVFYLTVGSTRKKIAIYDDTSGATGDLYYRNSSGLFARYGVGSDGQVLRVAGTPAVPTWGANNSGHATATKTTGYTVTATDTVIFADASSGNVTVTLPVASGLSGYKFYVKRIDNTLANTVQVTRTGSDTIDGQTSISFPAQYMSMTLVSNGSNWFIL